MPYVIAFGKPRIIWAMVPKAGVKSVNRALHDIVRVAPWEPEIISTGLLDAYLGTRYKGWFCFTVVRHPVERFESMFYQRVNEGDINDYALAFQDTPMATTNPHGMRQVDLIGSDLSRYDFVGHLEHMDEVQDALYPLVRYPQFTIGHLNASVRGPKLTGEAREAIVAHYAADFELLGYDP
jgi:hypothetical protein